jgi:hypothetical protein
MSFTVFDGANPKLWKRRCETYFKLYVVPMHRWIGLATMHFEESTTFWLQSIESKLREMNWEDLCVSIITRFGNYIEHFDQFVHQLLAHESQLTPTMIIARFVDGLRDEIKFVVVIQ